MLKQLLRLTKIWMQLFSDGKSNFWSWVWSKVICIWGFSPTVLIIFWASKMVRKMGNNHQNLNSFLHQDRENFSAPKFLKIKEFFFHLFMNLYKTQYKYLPLVGFTLRKGNIYICWLLRISFRNWEKHFSQCAQ